MIRRPLPWFVLFIAAIVGANVLTQRFGLVTVAGLTATAGTWVAGLTFVFRDLLHDAGGVRWIAPAILAGTALSAMFSPELALASAVAFLVAESADWAVYAPLRRHGYIAAAILSNTAGALLDSWLFLAIAGFPTSGALTQTVIKVCATTVVVLGVSRAIPREPLHRPGRRSRHA